MQFNVNFIKIWYKYGTNMLQLCYNYATNMVKIWYKYGPFAVERYETLKKIKNELILNLDKL